MIARRVARHFMVGLSLLILWAAAAHDQNISLTSEQIAEAIAWGRSAQPDAYVLRSAFTTNKTPPGAAYTPYLRVALAARAAADQQRKFTAQDITAEMTAPLIYFAIGDYGADPLPLHSLPPGAPLSMRLITEHSHPRSPLRREVSPVWIRFEVPAYLRYGLRPDWSYAFGAFPIEQVKADTRVELYREHREGSRPGYGGARLGVGSGPPSVEMRTSERAPEGARGRYGTRKALTRELPMTRLRKNPWNPWL